MDGRSVRRTMSTRSPAVAASEQSSGRENTARRAGCPASPAIVCSPVASASAAAAAARPAWSDMSSIADSRAARALHRKP
jgi:hypothetical protein